MLNLFLKVPFISNILDFLQSETIFRKLVNASFFIFGDLLIFQNFLPFQYGKTYTKGKSLLRVEIRDRFSVFLVHSSGPITFLYSYFFFYAKSNLYELNYDEKYIYKLNNDIIHNVQSTENAFNSKQSFKEADTNLVNGKIQNNEDKNDFATSQNHNNNDDNFEFDGLGASKHEDKDANSHVIKKMEYQKKIKKGNKNNLQPFTFKAFMKSFISMPSILYLFHYMHRVFVYPWFRSSHSRPWPLESILFFSITNMMSGLVLSWSLFFKYRRLPILVQVILSILFIPLMALSSFHDYYLCSLRQPGESGYRIPKGLCFNWVSCPHYTFELAEWFVFGFFLGGDLGVRYLFWLIGFLNLSIRASSSTTAYRKMFNLKYHVRKKSFLPIFYSPV
ncbi:hypothetical protein M9Y10_024105 [Tritrichomonas musculus]|uniref:3-oxo-5-alpha-steroid 4-dehydrogenase C-terminal domain-containing protein n=1 Tax=Tritrichomonas musculus TaxID=1915356 RepID=A0ABR2KX27_9EUKA